MIASDKFRKRTHAPTVELYEPSFAVKARFDPDWIRVSVTLRSQVDMDQHFKINMTADEAEHFASRLQCFAKIAREKEQQAREMKTSEQKLLAEREPEKNDGRDHQP